MEMNTETKTATKWGLEYQETDGTWTKSGLFKTLANAEAALAKAEREGFNMPMRIIER